MTDSATAVRRVPIPELVKYFLRLGATGFGGPAALCGQMERELVEQKHWLTKSEMRDAIAVSQSLPGPLAIQVGIFAAYMRGGFPGAWAGGWAFILPNFLIVAAITHCTPSSMPSFVSRQQECRIMAITAGLAP